MNLIAKMPENSGAESKKKRIRIRFYAQLNDFLPPEKRKQTIAHEFDVSGSIKDTIESIGVPHTEVDVILANGQPVDFAYRIQDGDRISVFPRFRSIPISPHARLQPPALAEGRFVADGHLGRLAAYLRMLGFDTLYQSDYRDEDVARLSANEDRTLLTRDRGLLKRNEVKRGYCLRSTEPVHQLVEVLREFELTPAIAPFRRCMHCNALLRATEKEAVEHRLLPETAKYFDEFYLCPACNRVYWKGSHYRRMQHLIENILPPAGEP